MNLLFALSVYLRVILHALACCGITKLLRNTKHVIILQVSKQPLTCSVISFHLVYLNEPCQSKTSLLPTTSWLLYVAK